MIRRTGRAGVVLGLVALAGCQSAYYSAWEKMGYHKRDILVSRVKAARDDQEAAKEQFKTTLDRFRSVVNFNGGDLQTEYDKLNAEYERCETKAKAVSKQIASVEEVSGALFKEWEGELGEYHDPSLRRRSEDELRATHTRYEELIGAMKRAEGKMEPVLGAFHDQVLFMKHNLNARAIASLQNTKVSIEGDVAQLIREMDASIAEANRFIDQMKDK